MKDMDPNKSLPLPRKRPKQARSKLLYDSIIESCKKIVLAEGSENLTPSHVSEVCGISVGSFYQYFPNIEALLTEIYMENMPKAEDLIKQMNKALEKSSTLEESLQAAIEFALRFHGERLNFNLSYYQKYHLYYQVICRDKNKELYEQRYTAYKELLERHKDSRGITNIDLKTFILTEFLSTSIHSTLEVHPEYWKDSELADLLLRTALTIIQPKIND